MTCAPSRGHVKQLKLSLSLKDNHVEREGFHIGLTTRSGIVSCSTRTIDVVSNSIWTLPAARIAVVAQDKARRQEIRMIAKKHLRGSLHAHSTLTNPGHDPGEIAPPDRRPPRPWRYA